MDLKFNIKHKYLLTLIYWYYPIVFIIYGVNVLLPLRAGVLSAILMIVLTLAGLVITPRSRNKTPSILVLFFLLYNVFSVIGYIFNNVPVSVFFEDFSNQTLPIVFFYIALNPMVSADKFYKKFIYSALFCFFTGLVLFQTNPPFYLSYLNRTIAFFNKDFYFLYPRLNSFLGSTAIGTISAVSVAIVLNKMRISKINLPLIIILLLGILCSILSGQRSSWVVTFASLAIFFIYSVRKKPKTIFISTIVLLTFLLVLVQQQGNFMTFLSSRIHTLGETLGERDFMWKTILEDSPNLILGTGLGSAGHKAMNYTNIISTDSSYFKILAELGFMGLFLFLLFCCFSISKGCHRTNNYYLELNIIFIFLLQAIGSNILNFQVLLPIFWFALGCIWRKSFLQ